MIEKPRTVSLPDLWILSFNYNLKYKFENAIIAA